MLFLLVLAVLAVVLVSGVTAKESAAASDCPACSADIALYDPSYEDDGVWEEEVKALKALFKKYGFSYKVVDANTINSGGLGVGPSRKFRTLVAPGGWATKRLAAVNFAGDTALRSFVDSGGGYIGFCAGAYWAAKTVSFAMYATGSGGKYNKTSDYKTYSYDLGLLSGTAQGPLGWEPWDDGTNATFDVTSIKTSVSAMKKAKMPSTTRLLYYGGPFFVKIDPKPANYEVWAKAVKPDGTSSSASTGSGKPTVIRYSYGKGTVVLFAYHPDILIKNDTDKVTLKKYIDEKEVKWKTGSQTYTEIAIDNWNIVHAAIQVAIGKTVTPVTKL